MNWVANWLLGYCLEPWQTSRCQIYGHYISSCILHLFSPHFYPLGRDVCSQDKLCSPRTHLIALQLNACAACSPLLFSHLTKILCLKNSWVEDIVPQQKLLCNWAVVHRKSLQPDSVTLPSVGSAGLRGSWAERLLSPAPASSLKGLQNLDVWNWISEGIVSHSKQNVFLMQFCWINTHLKCLNVANFVVWCFNWLRCIFYAIQNDEP